MSLISKPQALLFDLDGTLVDTAPDLAEATNLLRDHHQLPRMPFSSIRPEVSNGGSALVKLALGLELDHPEHQTARNYLLDQYETVLSNHSEVFPGLRELIEDWVAAGKPWGIVTNKPRQYAVPLIKALELYPDVLFCADDFPVKKPDPLPLLKAAEALSTDPEKCWYFGDHLRDMQAAKAANMTAIATVYGYIDSQESAEQWPYDIWVESPLEIAALIEKKLVEVSEVAER